MIDERPERVRDTRTAVDRWPVEELESAFRAVANETRLEILLAIFHADRWFVRFSEIKAAVSIRDNGNLAYHLDELEGRFIRHEEGSGYALVSPVQHVLPLVLTGSLAGESERSAAPLDEPCPTCPGTLRLTYGDDHQAAIECHDCETTFRGKSLPPGVIGRREPSDVAAIVDVLVRSDLEFYTAGVCPYCRGRLRSTLIPAAGASERIRVYDRDESDGAYVEFDCDWCTSSFVIPAAILLFRHAEAAAFFADHGRRLRSIPFWRAFAWNGDGGAAVTDDGRLRVSVTLDDETLTTTFDEQLRPVEVERTRRIAGDE